MNNFAAGMLIIISLPAVFILYTQKKIPEFFLKLFSGPTLTVYLAVINHSFVLLHAQQEI